MNIVLKFVSQASYQILDKQLSSFKLIVFMLQAFSWTKIAQNSFVLGITSTNSNEMEAGGGAEL